VKRYTFAAVMLLLVVFPWRQAPQADTPAYVVEPLPTGPSIDNLVPGVTGINASGEITGTVSDNLRGSRAVRYTDGIGWEYVPGLTWGSTAVGINVNGDIVGTRVVGTKDHAYRYNAGSATIDDILPISGGTFTIGGGINDNGDVVGYGDISTQSQRAFVAAVGGSATALPTLGGDFGQACGINNAGQIAGTSLTADGLELAFRFDPGSVAPINIGSFDGQTGMSLACAIDQAGHVGGFATATSAAGTVFHAFRFDAPELPLVAADGLLPSTFGNVESIAAGMSAGWYRTADQQLHAMLHTDANGAVDLNSQIDPASGWYLTEIKGINASGQMVGDGVFGGVSGLVFRLSPPKVSDTTPPVINGVTLTPSTISMVNGQLDNVAVQVSATDDSGVAPTCSLTSIAGSGVAGTDYVVADANDGKVKAVGGRTYTFTVTCTDQAGNSSHASAPVVVMTDVTAPTINGVTATPAPVWPPKGQMVTVTVNVGATDDSGVVTCKLTSITAPLGAAPGDAVVLTDSTGNVKAVGGRTYTFNAQCTDFSGNTSPTSVPVFVTPDTTAPTITSFTASPSTISTPDNQLAPVTVTIVATDDVDDAPSCSLTGISAPGATSSDYSITSGTSAQVRAVGNRTYTLTATCSDTAGNQRTATTTVFVAPDTQPPTINSVTATPSTISKVDGSLVGVTVVISATDNSGSQSCKLSSISGPGVPGTDYAVLGTNSGNVRAVGGRVYMLNVTCTDAAGNSSGQSTPVTVATDNTVPVISSLTASPSVIAPPAWQMVPVTISVSASDDSGVVSCLLAGISGPGTPGVDFVITGAFTGSVKAVGGRTYTLTAQCTDFSGNSSLASTNVFVQPDTTPPVITAIVASPDPIKSPNGKMTQVTVTVTATDDVDGTPSCALTSVSGGGAGDTMITGALSADVRANKGASYVLTVTCSDRAGNQASASTTVSVGANGNGNGGGPKK